jgi:hypothetical protein
MPEAMGQQEDLEVGSARGVVVDNVAEGVISFDKYWFPYEWFLDSYTKQTDDLSVMSDCSVTKVDNKQEMQF